MFSTLFWEFKVYERYEIMKNLQKKAQELIK